MVCRSPETGTIQTSAGTFLPSAEEMEKAREVQSRLLSRRIPSLETLECACCYLPAGGIGGDYCDFFRLGLGRVGLALGDISGRGVPAALMMASLQAILRSHSATLANDLARLLRSVNRLFCECTGDNCFATLFLGEYNDGTRRLRYVNCGHPPPLLVRRDAAAERLPSTATVLGMFPDWTCGIGEMTLAPGDALLLFTDGVTEAVNETGDEFGASRLLETFQGCRHLALGALVRQLAEAVRSFGGLRLEDDLTLLVARAVEPA